MILIKYCALTMLVASAKARMSPKIVGGRDANIHEWPFIGFLKLSLNAHPDSLIICGSSLLSSQTILTAAHCLVDPTRNKETFYKLTITVLMGNADYRKATVKRQVIDFIGHEEYNEESLDNDLGIGFLESPVTFSCSVKKVLLQRKPLHNPGMLLIAGWGQWTEHLNKSFPFQYHLQVLPQAFIPHNICERYIDDLQEGVLCAGKHNFDKYVYGGDSGGPLVLPGGVQVGVVSYKLTSSHGLAVYTSVAHYLQWIEDTQKHLFQRHCNNERGHE